VRVSATCIGQVSGTLPGNDRGRRHVDWRVEVWPCELDVVEGTGRKVAVRYLIRLIDSARAPDRVEC